MLYAGAAGEHAMCAVGAGGCVLCASAAGAWRRGAVCSSACPLYARSAEGVLYVLDVSEVVVPYIVTIRLTERFRVK